MHHPVCEIEEKQLLSPGLEIREKKNKVTNSSLPYFFIAEIEVF